MHHSNPLPFYCDYPKTHYDPEWLYQFESNQFQSNTFVWKLFALDMILSLVAYPSMVVEALHMLCVLGTNSQVKPISHQVYN